MKAVLFRPVDPTATPYRCGKCGSNGNHVPAVMLKTTIKPARTYAYCEKHTPKEARG